MFMRRMTTLVAVVTLCAAAASSGPADAMTPTAGSYHGTLADGASWIADVPADWNHTLILYSHGYGPLMAQDAPDTATRTELLEAGYALVGSSYSGPSMWALASAVDDQFASLRAAEQVTGRPRRTLAWGTSMGGLVSALETQDPRRMIDGTLTTCGLVAGALNLNDYQLYGEYALAHLLAPGQAIPLVRYRTAAAAGAAAQTLSSTVAAAQATPAGRARIALGASPLNEPGWYDTPAPPAAGDYAGQEAQQERELTAFTLQFTMTGRQQIELAAGGNSSATAGVDFGAVLRASAQAGEVRALYRAAGLDLRADLNTLTRDADISADPAAVATLARTSMPTGRLRAPELDIHTIADQLVPVEQENWYGRLVRWHAGGAMFRRAHVDTAGHCAFRPSETIAALHALEHRLNTGRWDSMTTPSALNAAATALGDPGRYIRYRPARLVGGLGERR
jgi:hypothetical protein